MAVTSPRYILSGVIPLWFCYRSARGVLLLFVRFVGESRVFGRRYYWGAGRGGFRRVLALGGVSVGVGMVVLAGGSGFVA